MNYVPPPVGTIDKPTVLAPADGAGSGDARDIVTDEITAVEGGGIEVCETELIESVSNLENTTYDIINSSSNVSYRCFFHKIGLIFLITMQPLFR